MTDYHNIYENTVTVFFYLHKIIVKGECPYGKEKCKVF